MKGHHSQEEGEEAGGDVAAIYGDGCGLVITKPSLLSPLASPTSVLIVANALSGCGTRPLFSTSDF